MNTSISHNGARIIALAALTLLMVACSRGPSSAGSGGSSNSGGSAAYRSSVAFSRCMRSHGVPNYPDPTSGGELPKGEGPQFGVSNSQFDSADEACDHLLGSGSLNANSLRQCELTGNCPPALVQRALTEMRAFSQCMRSHGMTNFPDPTTNSQGAPYFPLSSAGISEQESRSPQFNSRSNACAHEMPDTGGMPVG